VSGAVHSHARRLINPAMLRYPHVNVRTSGRLAQLPHCTGRRKAHDSACERARHGDAVVQAARPARGYEHAAAGPDETSARNQRAKRSVGNSDALEPATRRYAVARLKFCCKSRFADRHISSTSRTAVGRCR
jgi:hypothetical protein